jgi:hypothetical protein
MDEQDRLTPKVPNTIPPGLVMFGASPASFDDDAGQAWLAGVAREWADELGDPREDIYTLADGEALSMAAESGK